MTDCKVGILKFNTPALCMRAQNHGEGTASGPSPLQVISLFLYLPASGDPMLPTAKLIIKDLTYSDLDKKK